MKVQALLAPTYRRKYSNVKHEIKESMLAALQKSFMSVACGKLQTVTEDTCYISREKYNS